MPNPKAADKPEPVVPSIGFANVEQWRKSLFGLLEDFCALYVDQRPALQVTSTQGYFTLTSWSVEEIDTGEAWILYGEQEDERVFVTFFSRDCYLLDKAILKVTVL